MGLLVVLCLVYLFYEGGDGGGPERFSAVAVPAILVGVGISLSVSYFLNRRLIRYQGDPLAEADRQIDNLDEQLRQSNRLLQANNRRVQSVLENLQDGVIATVEDGRIITLTDRAAELLGAPLPARYLSSLGSNYARLAELQREFEHKVAKDRAVRAELLSADETDAAEAPANSSLPNSEKLTVDFTITYPVSRTLQVTASPLPLVQEDRGMLYVISDVTHIRYLETIRSEFVSNVTHELKTPLTSIQGYLELLMAAPRDEETRSQFYEIMSIETDRLKSLINDLLNLSEIEQSGERHKPRRPIKLRQLAEVILAGLEPQIEAKHLRIDNGLAEDLTFAADEVRMDQLFSNLLSNAVKYNVDGGEVRLSGNVIRNRLELAVSDTGMGIPYEEQERIFERFYRVNKSRSREIEGTGLGLSIVKHIVSLYDGSIQIDSEPGRGTSFIILFPLV